MGCRPAAQLAQLAACPIGPQGRAQLGEDRQRLPERIARLSPLAPAPVDHPEREQRAGALERHRQPLVHRERGGGGLERRVEVASGGCEQRLAARRDRRGPGARRDLRPPAQPLEQVVGPLELAERDRRLQLVAVEAEPGRLAQADRRHGGLGAGQVPVGRRRLVE